MFKIRSQVTKDILNYFLLNQAKKTYINELARLLGKDPKNVHKYLLELEDLQILKSEFKGKERYFFSNRSNPSYKEYRKMFLKTYGIDSVIKAALKDIKDIKEAYIYGSYAKDKMGDDSDIDLLIISDENTMDIEKALFNLQKQFSREINILNITPKQLEILKKVKDQLITDIFSNKHIKIL